MANNKKPKAPPALTDKEYLAEARGWEIDRVVQLQKSERIAWIVAGTSLFATICIAIAIAVMMPLKRVEPYVVRVDNATGIVDVVNSLKTTSSDYSEAVTKYFLIKYVRGREGYDYKLIDAAYNEVMQLSGGKQARQYSTYILPRNPESPVNRMKQRGTVEIKIKSVQFLKKDQASVRYLRILRNDGALISQTDWIATINFDYVRANAAATAREVNPLGFQVLEYRTDPEVINNADRPVVDSTMPVTLPTS